MRLRPLFLLLDMFYFLGSLFLVVSWLLPNHYPPWVNFHSEFVAFLGLGVLLWSWLKASPVPMAVPTVAVATLFLAALPCVQYSLNLIFFAGDAVVSSFYVFGFAVAIVLGFSHSLVGTNKDGAWLLPARVLATAAIVSTLLAVLQWLSLTEGLSTFVTVTDTGDRAVANLGQPNQLGSLLLMGLAAAVLMYERHTGNSLLFIICSLAFTWGIVLTESRTAIVSALVMAGFMGYKIRSRRLAGEPMRLRLSHIFAWLGAYFLAAMALPAINTALLLHQERGIALFNDNGRSTIWRQTLFAIFESPWLGYGWNQTPVAQAAGAIFHPGELAFTNAHNVVLDLLAWVGLPLGLALTAGFIYWVLTRIKAVSSTGAIYAMAMLIPVLVHSMLEFPFAYAYFLLTAGFLVGIVESDYVSKIRVTVAKRAALIGLAAFAVIGSYSAYEYLLIEEDYRVARFENLNVGRTEAHYQPPAILIHTQLAALLAAIRQPAVRQMDSVQMERLRQVALRFGMRPLVFRYAVALGLNGESAAAAAQMLVFRNMFGERAYQRFKVEFQIVQAEKYPELAAIPLP
jgi:O-antigen ligase